MRRCAASPSSAGESQRRGRGDRGRSRRARLATAENAITAMPTPRCSISDADDQAAGRLEDDDPGADAGSACPRSPPPGSRASRGRRGARDRRARRPCVPRRSAITEASRSIAEWIASVMIAIEPVIAPAASLSAIRIELETIESAAAPDLVRITSRSRRCGRARSRRERPRGAAAVADRVLLVRLAARPSCARRRDRCRSGTKAGS